jgi:hypothetical protein
MFSKNNVDFNIYLNKSFLNILTFFTALFYLFIIYSTLIQFIPIVRDNWFNIGMGKYVGLAAIFAIFSLFYKNFFVAFFISIFAGFFTFHELIIFYDNYSIELGQELMDNGAFRYLPDIVKNAYNFKFGFFWSILGSSLSLISVSICWIYYHFILNYKK